MASIQVPIFEPIQVKRKNKLTRQKNIVPRTFRVVVTAGCCRVHSMKIKLYIPAVCVKGFTDLE